MVRTAFYSRYAKRTFPIRCGKDGQISALHDDPWYTAEERLARVTDFYHRNNGKWKLREEALIRWMQGQSNRTLIEAANLYLDGMLADRGKLMEYEITGHAIDLTDPVSLHDAQRRSAGFINQILAGREGAVLKDVCEGSVIAVIPCENTCGYDFFGYTFHHPKKARESFTLALLERAARWITSCVV